MAAVVNDSKEKPFIYAYIPSFFHCYKNNWYKVLFFSYYQNLGYSSQDRKLECSSLISFLINFYSQLKTLAGRMSFFFLRQQEKEIWGVFSRWTIIKEHHLYFTVKLTEWKISLSFDNFIHTKTEKLCCETLRIYNSQGKESQWLLSCSWNRWYSQFRGQRVCDQVNEHCCLLSKQLHEQQQRTEEHCVLFSFFPYSIFCVGFNTSESVNIPPYKRII